MSNTSYSPSDIVKRMHEVLHLDSGLSEVSNQFDITTDSTWNNYTKSLLPIPIICMAIGLLAVIIFQISSCCYCCCKKKPLAPEYRDPNAPNVPLRNCWIAFAVFFIIVLVYDQSMIFGNEYLSDGVSTVNGGLDYLEVTFNNLTSYGDQLDGQGDRLVADFQASISTGCAASNTFLANMDEYFSYVDEYQSYVEDVPGQCSDAQDAVHKYAVDYKDKTVWVFYAMFIVCLLIYLFGLLCKNKPTVFTGMCVTDIVMFLTFIICGVVMILLVRTYSKFVVLSRDLFPPTLTPCSLTTDPRFADVGGRLLHGAHGQCADDRAGQHLQRDLLLHHLRGREPYAAFHRRR